MSEAHPTVPVQALVSWPNPARIDRVIPKRALASAASTPAKVRQRLTDGVEQVRWLFTLSPALTTLPGTPEVPEFVVIGIDLRAPDLDVGTLEVLDRSMPRRVIFELTRTTGEGREHRMAAFLSARGPDGRGQHLTSAWVPAEAPRTPLPAAIDLEALYLAVLEPLLPVPRASGSRVSEMAERIEAVATLDRRINALERKIQREVQFNRQVALRQELRELQRERDVLT